MSSARHRLKSGISAEDLSQAQFAREIRVHRSHVGHLISGQRRPTLVVAIRIERATARWADGPIRAAEWCEQDELAVGAAAA